MNKFFKKLFPKSRGIVLLLFFIILAGILIPQTVNAALDPLGVKKAFIGAITTIILWAVFLIGKLVGVIVWVMIEIAQYNEFINSPAVSKGWIIIRDLFNMFFVVILLVIAFSAVLKIEKYPYKRMLSAFLIAAVLVNFSKLICGVLIDFSQILMLTFVNAFKDVGGENFIKILGLRDIVSLSENAPGEEIGNASLLGTYILGLIFSIVALVVMLVVTLIFAFRIVGLWFLVVLSPLAFMATVLPATQSYGRQWWQKFTNYLIIGPVLAFFIWLSLAVVQESSTIIPPSGPVPNIDASIATAGKPDFILNFIIGIGMLIGSLMVAKQLGVAGAGIATKAIGKMQAVASGVAKGTIKMPWKGAKAGAKIFGRTTAGRKVRSSIEAARAGLVGKGVGPGRLFMKQEEKRRADELLEADVRERAYNKMADKSSMTAQEHKRFAMDVKRKEFSVLSTNQTMDTLEKGEYRGKELSGIDREALLSTAMQRRDFIPDEHTFNAVMTGKEKKGKPGEKTGLNDYLKTIEKEEGLDAMEKRIKEKKDLTEEQKEEQIMKAKLKNIRYKEAKSLAETFEYKVFNHNPALAAQSEHITPEEEITNVVGRAPKERKRESVDALIKIPTQEELEDPKKVDRRDVMALLGLTLDAKQFSGVFDTDQKREGLQEKIKHIIQNADDYKLEAQDIEGLNRAHRLATVKRTDEGKPVKGSTGEDLNISKYVEKVDNKDLTPEALKDTILAKNIVAHKSDEDIDSMDKDKKEALATGLSSAARQYNKNNDTSEEANKVREEMVRLTGNIEDAYAEPGGDEVLDSLTDAINNNRLDIAKDLNADNVDATKVPQEVVDQLGTLEAGQILDLYSGNESLGDRVSESLYRNAQDENVPEEERRAAREKITTLRLSEVGPKNPDDFENDKQRDQYIKETGRIHNTYNTKEEAATYIKNNPDTEIATTSLVRPRIAQAATETLEMSQLEKFDKDQKQALIRGLKEGLSDFAKNISVEFLANVDVGDINADVKSGLAQGMSGENVKDLHEKNPDLAQEIAKELNQLAQRSDEGATDAEKTAIDSAKNKTAPLADEGWFKKIQEQQQRQAPEEKISHLMGTEFGPKKPEEFETDKEKDAYIKETGKIHEAYTEKNEISSYIEKNKEVGIHPLSLANKQVAQAATETLEMSQLEKFDKDQKQALIRGLKEGLSDFAKNISVEFLANVDVGDINADVKSGLAQGMSGENVKDLHEKNPDLAQEIAKELNRLAQRSDEGATDAEKTAIGEAKNKTVPLADQGWFKKIQEQQQREKEEEAEE